MAATDFKGLLSAFEEFKGLFDQPNPNLERCKDLMGKLKVRIITLAKTDSL
jgi:hypothetical protein